jgi:hypothetical protein
MLGTIEVRPKWLSLQDPEPVDQIWSFFTFDPTVPITPPTRPKHSLMHFEDTCLAHFRDSEEDVMFSVRCGPPYGYHAYRHARGPCDRLGMTPRWGHFCLTRGNDPLLGTPLSGYSLRTNLGSCLLIDDRGQKDDVGYPMSLPSTPYHGQEIEAVEWDASRESGLVRLNLTPAYPDEFGVILYRREFLIRPTERTIICRDTIALDAPRRLSWLFQSPLDLNPRLERSLVYKVGQDSSGLSIEPHATGDLSLAASIHPTGVVHSYSSQHRDFVHLRYDTKSPASSACVDFAMLW